ncbi:LTA synthase family protein [Blautia sp. MSJ-19]|uniref:LTA synthase family protein n=1 Tax=Blautia sp. MSJ-19 TaxID=2841517 RepID=UPI0020A187BF|nr:LTA synthase family protein [Blautia sp. MSJ-19]
MLLFNLVLIFVIELVFIVLTNHVRLGADICAFICVGFDVVNHFVYEFRGTPVMASDIATVGTAMEVADGYQISFNFYTTLAVILMFDFMLIGRTLKCERFFKKGVQRLCGIAVMAVVCVLGTTKVVMTDYVTNLGLYLSLFQPLTSYEKYGSIACFSRSIKLSVPEKPEGYSLEKVEEITSRYTSDTVDSSKKNPNIIVVINEAFSDPQVLGKIETNEDYMPFIHGLMESGNTVSGTTYASVAGGQTANTEYEFLTGNSMAFLPKGAVAFQLFVKHEMPSIVTELKSEGYTGNTAIHLQKPRNYNRDKVYPMLGFDKFYDYLNIEVPFVKMRNNGTDQCTYDNMTHDYEKFRENSDAPYFGYTMTIQNHSSYDVPFDNFDDKRITVDNVEAPDVGYYLSLIKYSDDAFKNLVEYYENVDEPTVILLTGDHQPRIKDASMAAITNGEYENWNDEEMMKRYAVPFVIWSNYGLEKKTVEKTSMNYLQTILMDSIGSELTGFQKFQQDIQKEIPVLTGNGYWGADGKFYSADDKTSPYYEWIKDYAILQYNDLTDYKNRAEDFFELKK